MRTVDINCDMGEGGQYDARLMDYISSCNIACGGHYGDKKSMQTTALLALEKKLKMGAHPSYPDKLNFGRKSMKLSSKHLKASLSEQIIQLKDIVENLGGRLTHIKPHGALYNDLVEDKEKSLIVIELVEQIDADLILFVPLNSVLEKLAKNRLHIYREVFGDRNYLPTYQLVPRQNDNALIQDPDIAVQRIRDLVFNASIQTINEKRIKVNFETVCYHSDTENSLEILQKINRELRKNAIAIA